uniref:Uncharacterized protein n=1 Tax=Zooxanthella nutricula TaxID=1333877 RepID=A0A7S2QC54_9DINO
MFVGTEQSVELLEGGEDVGREEEQLAAAWQPAAPRGLGVSGGPSWRAMAAVLASCCLVVYALCSTSVGRAEPWAASLGVRWSGGALESLSAVTRASEAAPCLCVFDVDRTLTGKQGWAQQCSAEREFPDIPDYSYMKGSLILSDLAQNLNSTFCKPCYRGIVTAGPVSGPNSPERAQMLRQLGGTYYTRSNWWQDVKFNPKAQVRSSLVFQALDGQKQAAVLSMLDWWKNDQHVDIKKEDVYFFDDFVGNVKPFAGTGLNAKQVSCQSRGPKENFPGVWEGKIGGCGGTAAEVVGDKGIKVC